MKAPKFVILLIAIALLLIVNLLIGTVKIPIADVCRILGGGGDNEIWTNIIFSSRLPQALTAIVAGAGLAVSGLQMQTVFRNPLAGPSVLGISNGSALGVAFVVWGLGSFSRVSGDEMVLFIVLMCILLPLAFLLVKPLNLMLLGDNYAANLGLNIKRARMLIIISSGVLVAIVTAYCGPIMFIGLAVPHLARAIFRTSDHRLLMPATALCGAALALLCNLIARMPGFEGALPVNSVTALVGAPVIAMVIFRRRKHDFAE